MEKWSLRLVAVHLSDSLYCSDAGKFISVLLSALSIMVNLECAQINVLSKQDLLEDDDLPYNFEFFEQLPDALRLVELLDVSIHSQMFSITQRSLASAFRNISVQ